MLNKKALDALIYFGENEESMGSELNPPTTLFY
jgi:hypothetical protein